MSVKRGARPGFHNRRSVSENLRISIEEEFFGATTRRIRTDDVLSDSRWDMTYLGMQVLIEGLALAAFAGIRDTAKNSLAAAINAS
jgi:hypothetical protein